MTTPGAYDYYRAARNAVLAAARSAGAEITDWPVPGMTSLTRQRAEPLAGIRAARSLERAALRVTGDYIRLAREDGLDWREIGAALGLEPDDGDLAMAAWEYASGPRYRMDPLYFYFTCPGCGQAVRDYGPHGGHPEDCEQGHAEDCTRMAEAVRAYKAQWEDEGGTDE